MLLSALSRVSSVSTGANLRRPLPLQSMEADRPRVATARRARLRGLALMRRSRAGAGLLIPDCRSVHTFGMLFRLDIRFLDGEGKVVRDLRGVPPGRVLSCRAAASVLEVPSARPAHRLTLMNGSNNRLLIGALIAIIAGLIVGLVIVS
ncbi:MAG: DUF192 domain-containing protein, partial [Solirubrobacterales bacterium]